MALEFYIAQLDPCNEADLQAVCRIEAGCFPPEERESMAVLKERAQHAPDFFWLARRVDNQEIIGFANGIPTRQSAYTDAVFTDISLCDHGGAWVMLISIDVAPLYQKQGIAPKLFRRILAELQGRRRYKGVCGICKESLVKYYEALGAKHLGLSACHYGGAVWHDMRIDFE